MSYDWKETIQTPKYTLEWFDTIDRRFVYSSRLFAHNSMPFGNVIPFDLLPGKNVLEIGCGMGLHTELMIRAGANVTSVDISSTSVDATLRRTSLKGLISDVRQMDASSLEFADESFDFVWSWGVIHHSSYTGRIVKEIHRVLRPGGETRVMVYNIEGMPAYITLLSKYIAGFWRGRSLDEFLWRSTDGYTARFYSKDTLSDLFNTFFADVGVRCYGQDADVVPLPSRIRKLVLRIMAEERVMKLAERRGAFLLVRAIK
jgi:2-polyprenyl-3-methyl-5-hydroxy-6-metoxy-1,4-benzoquinol methylase